MASELSGFHKAFRSTAFPGVFGPAEAHIYTRTARHGAERKSDWPGPSWHAYRRLCFCDFLDSWVCLFVCTAYIGIYIHIHSYLDRDRCHHSNSTRPAHHNKTVERVQNRSSSYQTPPSSNHLAQQANLILRRHYFVSGEWEFSERVSSLLLTLASFVVGESRAPPPHLQQQELHRYAKLILGSCGVVRGDFPAFPPRFVTVR